MRMYPKEFPPKRRRKPTRRAELRIFNALASSTLAGFAYYEWRRDFGEPELDFAVWLRDLGRGALQVKGGPYELVNGDWFLHTQGDAKPIRSSPIDEAWLSALDLHDDILEKARTPYDPFVAPVLAFPDMDPDEQIAKLARRKSVSLIWRPDQPAVRLQEILRAQHVRQPLSAERISREVHAATDGVIDLALDQVGDVSSTGGAGCPQISDNCTATDPTQATKRFLISLGNVGLLEARARVIQVHTELMK